MAEQKKAPPVFLEPIKETFAQYKKELDELNKRIPEGYTVPDELYVYRFLRGYQFDIDQASAALNASLKWRKEYGADAIREKNS